MGKRMNKIESGILKVKKYEENNTIRDILDDEQKHAINIIDSNVITLLTGIWGTGKTLTAVYYALKKLEEGKIEKITICRPTSKVDEIGYLKGGIREKMEPLMIPIIRTMEKLIGKTKTDYFLDKGIVEIIPFQYMRGVNFFDIIICDEVQNMDLNSFKTIATRLCKGAKLILCGDIHQTDIPMAKSGLSKFINFQDKEFSIVELHANHRSPIVERISQFFESIES